MSLNPVLVIGPQITKAIHERKSMTARTARARAIELVEPRCRIDECCGATDPRGAEGAHGDKTKRCNGRNADGLTATGHAGSLTLS